MGTALDFGCGVWRLTQPLADHFKEVCGIDISPNFIELANKLDILVRKSWNKDKIYAIILEDKNKENELKQFIYDLDFYKINPIYENELIQLIDYKKRIAQLIQLLFFI